MSGNIRSVAIKFCRRKPITLCIEGINVKLRVLDKQITPILPPVPLEQPSDSVPAGATSPSDVRTPSVRARRIWQGRSPTTLTQLAAKPEEPAGTSSQSQRPARPSWSQRFLSSLARRGVTRALQWLDVVVDDVNIIVQQGDAELQLLKFGTLTPSFR